MKNTFKEVEIRVEILKKFHEYFIELGDEDLYMDWIVAGVPDEPSEEDYEYIANDISEFRETVQYAINLL